MKNSSNKSGIIVAFNISRGGNSFNGGHMSYLGEKNFQALLLQESNNLFPVNRDDRGKFCAPYFADAAGNTVSSDSPKALVGTLDFDGDYGTIIAKHIEDCDHEELELIARNTNEYKSEELVKYTEKYYSELRV